MFTWTIKQHTNAQELRWYQRESIDSIYQYFDNGNNGNPVLALPTGSGKTLVIVNFIKEVLNKWPNQRFIISTHVKELIEQQIKSIHRAWPHAPFGVNSAGLKQRECLQPIIIGGIQSMYRQPEIFGHRDLMIVDEAHLVSPNDGTMYQQFIQGLRLINPNMKVIGLSATIFRQGQGLITDQIDGSIFTDICYNLCDIQGFAKLIAEGFLSPLYPKRTSIEIDTSNVSLGNNGDYNQKQLQEAANKDRVTHLALQEAIHYGQNRRSWLAFASGIEHAEKITEMLNQMGVPSVCVHSKLKGDERDKRIQAHKRGEVRCMVGNNIFTTGYDHPPLDFIIDLQPTMSVAKHVQKYGRLMRTSPETGKENGLVMDFGGNTRRCGPINDPYIPKRKDKGEGDAPVKICEFCGTYNHAAARFCDACGEEFEFRVKIVKEADETPIIKSELPVIEEFSVDAVICAKQTSKKTGIPYMRVMYRSGMQMFTENVFLENPGYASKRGRDWWRQRHWIEPPDTIDEALKFQSELRIPKAIKVWVNREHPEITKVEWYD